jgi:hypothetical protein
MCKDRVVLPEDSGPNISIILPLGIPPTPRAISRPSDPVGTTFTFTLGVSPNFMIAPSPNFVWILFKVFSRTVLLPSLSPFFSLSFFLIIIFCPPDDGSAYGR